MKGFAIILLFFCLSIPAFPQKTDTNFLKILYDRSINFSEDKLDSINWNSNFIEHVSDSLRFPKGKILASRLKGLYYDLSGNYEEAIGYFLRTLAASRESKFTEYEISALSDLAIVYTEIKQPEKAKLVYLECLRLTEQRGEINSIISGYSNIGAIYNILHQTDSALAYLTTALKLSRENNNQEMLPFIFNNTGNVYFKRKDYPKALEYFKLNKIIHDSTHSIADLWTDHLNLGDTYLELGKHDSALKYSQSALEIAKQLQSKSKEADANSLLAKLYERLGQYKKAYAYQKDWYRLDTALVNESSGQTIAEMQEKFNALDREKQNQLLLSEVGKANIKNKYLSYISIATILVGLLVGAFLLVYYQANRKLKEVNLVIIKQKEKLAALNQEKNSLISMVSHDLSTPFASITMWSHHLGDGTPLSPVQQKAMQKIKESAENGERLIRIIMAIEKKGTSHQELALEETDLTALVKYIVNEQAAIGAAKSIHLQFQPGEGIFLMTDQDLIRRVLENLLSNAIKFSQPGKNVWVELTENEGEVILNVNDEGPGISEADQQHLFTKYKRLSNEPTAGEGSSGLGLSIVKRLVNELNGEISLQSEVGTGTKITIRFRK